MKQKMMVMFAVPLGDVSIALAEHISIDMERTFVHGEKYRPTEVEAAMSIGRIMNSSNNSAPNNRCYVPYCFQYPTEGKSVAYLVGLGKDQKEATASFVSVVEDEGLVMDGKLIMFDEETTFGGYVAIAGKFNLDEPNDIACLMSIQSALTDGEDFSETTTQTIQ